MLDETIPIYGDGRHYDLLYGTGDPQFWVELAQEYGAPIELDALFHYNGFAIEHKYGDMDRSPFGAGSSAQIYVLTHRPLE